MTQTPAPRWENLDRVALRGEQVAAVVALAIAGVALLCGGLVFLTPVPLAVGLVALSAALVSTAMIAGLVYRSARRGERGRVRSMGRAAWEGLKFLFSFP